MSGVLPSVIGWGVYAINRCLSRMWMVLVWVWYTTVGLCIGCAVFEWLMLLSVVGGEHVGLYVGLDKVAHGLVFNEWRPRHISHSFPLFCNVNVVVKSNVCYFACLERICIIGFVFSLAAAFLGLPLVLTDWVIMLMVSFDKDIRLWSLRCIVLSF